MVKTFKSSRIRTISRRPHNPWMFTIPWEVKEPTHYSKRVGHKVPGVVAVLCESIAGPQQLIAAKKTQPAQSNKWQTDRSNNSIDSLSKKIENPTWLLFRNFFFSKSTLRWWNFLYPVSSCYRKRNYLECSRRSMSRTAVTRIFCDCDSIFKIVCDS